MKIQQLPPYFPNLVQSELVFATSKRRFEEKWGQRLLNLIRTNERFQLLNLYMILLLYAIEKLEESLKRVFIYDDKSPNEKDCF